MLLLQISDTHMLVFSDEDIIFHTKTVLCWKFNISCIIFNQAHINFSISNNILICNSFKNFVISAITTTERPQLLPRHNVVMVRHITLSKLSGSLTPKTISTEQCLTLKFNCVIPPGHLI